MECLTDDVARRQNEYLERKKHNERNSDDVSTVYKSPLFTYGSKDSGNAGVRTSSIAPFLRTERDRRQQIQLNSALSSSFPTQYQQSLSRFLSETDGTHANDRQQTIESHPIHSKPFDSKKLAGEGGSTVTSDEDLYRYRDRRNTLHESLRPVSTPLPDTTGAFILAIQGEHKENATKPRSPFTHETDGFEEAKNSSTVVYIGGDNEEVRHTVEKGKTYGVLPTVVSHTPRHPSAGERKQETIREEKEKEKEKDESSEGVIEADTAASVAAVGATPLDHHLNQTLLKWKSQCFVNMRLHRKSYYHFKRIYDMLSYPIMILAAVTSGSVLGSDTQAVRYSSATLSLIIIVLTSVIRHVRPAEAAQQHENFSRKFEVLLQTLQSVVGSPLSAASMKERDDFVTELRTKLDELVTSRLPPPSSVIKNYEAHHGPVDGILYGEDMVSVLVNQARTAHLINAINRVAATDDDHGGRTIGANAGHSSAAPSFDYREKILSFDRDAMKRMMGKRDRTGYDDARRGGAISRFFDWIYSGKTATAAAASRQRKGEEENSGDVQV